MSILVDKRTRVITHVASGHAGRQHTAACRAYGNGRRCFVAGVNPAHDGDSLDGLPVFGSVEEARAATGATVSVVYLAPSVAAAAIDEAIDAGIALVVCITDGIPADEMRRLRRRLQDSRTLLLGPQCPGIVTPDQIVVGPLPGHGYRPGRIGIVSRRCTLAARAAAQLAACGLGQSTVVGLGGDAAGGLGDTDVLALFDADAATDAVLLLDGVGSDDDDGRCARWIADHMHKPVFAFAGGSTPQAVSRLRDCGVQVTCDADALGELVAERVDPPWLPFD